MVRGVVSPTTIRCISVGCLLALAAVCTAVLTVAQSGSHQISALPGKLEDGSVLLPNGWRIAPAGKHLGVGTLPLNIVVTQDGRYAIVVTSGLMRPALAVIDVATWTVKNTYQLDNAWYGLTLSPDGTKVYVGGGGQNNVQEFSYADGVLTKARTLALPGQTGQTFAGGLAISRDGKTLYVTRVFAMTLSAIDLGTGQVARTVQLEAEPYAPVVSPDGRFVYVSLWGGCPRQCVFRRRAAARDGLPSGDHPSAMTFSVGRQTAVRGQRPTARGLGLRHVFVGRHRADLDEPVPGRAAHVDAECAGGVARWPPARCREWRHQCRGRREHQQRRAQLQVDGFIPTGAYPTGVAYLARRQTDPRVERQGHDAGRQPADGGARKAALRAGVDRFRCRMRARWPTTTARFYALTPYTRCHAAHEPRDPGRLADSARVGGSSPIKHVFYIIRENRTYDSDPRRPAAGQRRPVADALRQGHHAERPCALPELRHRSTISMSTPMSASMGMRFRPRHMRPTSSRRCGRRSMPTAAACTWGKAAASCAGPFGNVSAPRARLYLGLRDAVAIVTVRSYGEFVDHQIEDRRRRRCGRCVGPGLKGLVAPTYAGFDLDITDNKRVDNWLHGVPRLRAERQPAAALRDSPAQRSHQGHHAGALTPRAMIADNDLALGRIVEAVSNSVYWKDSVIFSSKMTRRAGPITWTRTGRSCWPPVRS